MGDLCPPWLEWSVLNLRSWNCFTTGTFTLKGSFGSCSSQLVPVAFSLVFPSRGWRLHLLLELTGSLYHADRRAWCSMVRLDYHEGKCSQNATVLAISSTWPQRLAPGSAALGESLHRRRMVLGGGASFGAPTGWTSLACMADGAPKCGNSQVLWLYNLYIYRYIQRFPNIVVPPNHPF